MKRRHSPEDATPVLPKQPKNCFPSNVYKFMKLNADPRMSLKLMQVCTYFQQQKFPFNVLSSLMNHFGKWTCTPFESKVSIANTKKIEEEVPEKLWLTGLLHIKSTQEDFSAMMEKILVSDIEVLKLYTTRISFHYLKFLCSNVKEVISMDTSFYDERNENITTVEHLLECLPNLESLTLDFATINSLEHLNRVLPPKLKTIKLREFDKTGDFSNFASFMIQHQHIKYEITSGTSWILRLKNCPQQSDIDRVIAAWHCQYEPPMITIFKQSIESKKALELLQERHNLITKKRTIF